MKTKIKIEISREKGETYFIFEIQKELEKLFKKKAIGIKTSSSWLEKEKGLKFYSMPETTTDQNYKNILTRHNLIDDYGTQLYVSADNRFNIAFIRTVGGKGKIKIKEDIPFAVVSNGVRNIVSFLKQYYSEYLRDYNVKGKLDFEV